MYKQPILYVLCLLCVQLLLSTIFIYHLSADSSTVHVRAELRIYPGVRSAPEQGGQYYIQLYQQKHACIKTFKVGLEIGYIFNHQYKSEVINWV